MQTLVSIHIINHLKVRSAASFTFDDVSSHVDLPSLPELRVEGAFHYSFLVRGWNIWCLFWEKREAWTIDKSKPLTSTWVRFRSVVWPRHSVSIDCKVINYIVVVILISMLNVCCGWKNRFSLLFVFVTGEPEYDWTADETDGSQSAIHFHTAITGKKVIPFSFINYRFCICNKLTMVLLLLHIF